MKWFKQVLMMLMVVLVFGSVYCHPFYASNSVYDELNKDKSMEDSEEAAEDEEQQVSEENSLPTMDSPSLLGTLLQLIIALVVVVGLIYFIANFVKKRNKYFDRNQVIKNYGGTTLGTNKSLQIVRIGERFFVVGLADNIELLLEVTDIDTIDQIKQADDIQAQPLDFIKEKMKKNDKNVKTTNKEFGHLFNKELDEMKEGRKKMLQKMKEIEKDHDH
jgi:flagellar protein FliO/FliZ